MLCVGPLSFGLSPIRPSFETEKIYGGPIPSNEGLEKGGNQTLKAALMTSLKARYKPKGDETVLVIFGNEETTSLKESIGTKCDRRARPWNVFIVTR